MSPAEPASGTSWERVCRELFAGDERAMLAWARRYLAAYPRVEGPEFHLGARFREIVGARNREQWWRTAAAALEARLADGAGTVREPAPPAYAAKYGRRFGPLPTIEARLKSFDESMARQRERERAMGLPPPEQRVPPADRGWTRQELYDEDEDDREGRA